MSPEEREELAALYALDLLEGDELIVFRKAIGGDPSLAAMVDEFRAASNLLGQSVPQKKAPTHLRERIIDAYVAQKAPPPPVTTEKSSRFGWLPWAVAAGLAVLMFLNSREKFELSQRLGRQKLENTGLDVRLASQEAERQRLEGTVTNLQDERDKLQARVSELEKHDPLSDIETVALAPQPQAPPNSAAMAIWNGKTQTGVLNAAKLPPPGPDRDYQLWIVPPGAAPVSAGILGNTPGANMPFRSPQAVAKVAAIAISLEPKGGSSSPSGPIVYMGSF